MKNLSWRAVLSDFWKEHTPTLQHHYPGINQFILNRWAYDLYGQGFFNQEEFLESYCISLEWQDHLKSGQPLEHLTREAYFYKSSFYVNSEVLIPRSETELLVERAVVLAKQHQNWTRFAEVGVGSGCLFLSFLGELSKPSFFTAIDLSPQALEVAKINSLRTAYQRSSEVGIEFLLSDRLEATNGQQYHMILSNPPYLIKATDEVHHQVDRFEPHMALYLPSEAYTQWFEVFFRQVFTSLYPGGYFLMEGNPETLKDLETMARNTGFIEVRTILDYHQRKRILEAKRG